MAKSQINLLNTSEAVQLLSDPTKPQKYKKFSDKKKSKAERVDFKLSYIMNSGGVVRAMINNKKVLVGDYVAGAKVTKISSNSVSLLVDGKQKILYLNRVRGIKRN